MALDKKGIMLTFLMTVILALIIFIPACIGISKLFRLSDQASGSYNNFLTDLKNIDKEQAGERRTTLLILDSETAVAYFEPNQPGIQLFVQGTGDIGYTTSSGENYDVEIKRPSSCSLDTACLCLLRKSTTEREFKDNFEQRCAGNNCGLVRIQGKATIIPEQADCNTEFQSRLVLDSCTLGVRHVTQGYHCSHGFLIERDLVQKTGISAYSTAPRRISFQLAKNEDTIMLEAK